VTLAIGAAGRLAPAGRARRAERRRLVAADLRAARLADLHHIRSVALAARAVVEDGWVQRAWFAYRAADGSEQVVDAHAALRIGDRPVVAACLAGAVVHAGGGLGAAATQPVQRTLDLAWHRAFVGDDDVHFCPGPPVRARHLRDLTAWNDEPGRTRAEVVDLLADVAETTRRLAAREL
jgi:hypothetical protein